MFKSYKEDGTLSPSEFQEVLNQTFYNVEIDSDFVYSKLFLVSNM